MLYDETDHQVQYYSSAATGVFMIAITNAKVITITQGTFEKGTVLIENNKITAVGENVQIPDGAEIIDASGKVVMPGLIDAHCHVGLFNDGIGWEYADGNEMTDPVTPHLRALDALHPENMAWPDLVAAGVTTVLTGPGSGNLIGGQWICVKTAPKPSVEQMILLEPAGMKMALGENPRRVYGGQNKMPSTRMGNAAVLRSALVDAQNYIQKWQQYETEKAQYDTGISNGEKPAKMPTPPERNLKHEALAKVLRREMKARVHAHRADDMLTAIRIAEEFNLDLTLEHATEGYKIVEILREKGIPVTVGPILFSRVKYELKEMTPKNPGILARAGIKVAIQTDEMSAVKYLAINAALAVREGMPEEEALKAITINPAEIIGVQERVGSLEAGKDADLVIFSGHPLDYRTVAEVVFINGERVYQRNTSGAA
jgi:imidazolonepropionase-like amidohydrolase